MESDEARPRRAQMHVELHDALLALQALLERRASELSDEVAHYPTPIARCDEQLPRLIEQRGEALGRLRALRAITQPEATDVATPAVAVEALLDGYGRPEDDEERALVSSIEAIARWFREARQQPQKM